MDIQTRKINFVKAFLGITNDNIISSLEHLLEVELRNDLKQMDVETLNKRIDESIADSFDDKITDNDALLEEVKKWT